MHATHRALVAGAHIALALVGGSSVALALVVGANIPLALQEGSDANALGGRDKNLLVYILLVNNQYLLLARWLVGRKAGCLAV